MDNVGNDPRLRLDLFRGNLLERLRIRRDNNPLEITAEEEYRYSNLLNSDYAFIVSDYRAIQYSYKSRP